MLRFSKKFFRLNINDICFSKKVLLEVYMVNQLSFQEKFIYCINGKALDIAVDLRKNQKLTGESLKNN